MIELSFNFLNYVAAFYLEYLVLMRQGFAQWLISYFSFANMLLLLLFDGGGAACERFSRISAFWAPINEDSCERGVCWSEKRGFHVRDL